jgi:hypothetical protein
MACVQKTAIFGNKYIGFKTNTHIILPIKNASMFKEYQISLTTSDL